MNQFCLECGTPIVEGDSRCRNCGAALSVQQKEEVVAVVTPKTPLSKKQKIVWGSIGVLAAIIIGFSLWANSYFSPESVGKRFNSAVESENAEKISKLVIHEDGTTITTAEAEAYLKLIKEEGKKSVEKLSTIVQHGKYLGMYKKHFVQTKDQFVYYNNYVDGLTITFNGEEIKESKRKKTEVTFGPLSPGVYDVEGIFEGKYGTSSNEDSVTLYTNNRDPYWLYLDLPIADVVFVIEDHWDLNASDSYILVNGEKIVTDEGTSEPVGPFLIDGSQKAKAVVTFPWGEVTSAEVSIDSGYVYITPTIISNDEYTKITNVLKTYGEQYVEALASNSTTPFTTITEEMKQEFLRTFDYNTSNNVYMSGSFEKLLVDKNSLSFVNDDDDMGIEIDARYYFQMDYHGLTEEPDLDERYDDVNVVLYYDKNSSEWKINNAGWAGFWYFEETDEFEGSKVLHKPSDEMIAEEKSKLFNKEIENFMVRFREYSVYAINSRYFSYVKDFHTSSGPSGKEASEYIEYLESKGITEEHLETHLEKLEEVDGTTWKVTTIDRYRIFTEDSTNEKKFRTVTVIKRVDDSFQVHELISSDEI